MRKLHFVIPLGLLAAASPRPTSVTIPWCFTDWALASTDKRRSDR